MPKSRMVASSEENVTTSHSSQGTRHIRTKESDAADMARAARIKELVGDDTGVEFSTACGFSEGMLRKYLKGATPGSDKISAMAKYRRVRIEWIETGEPPKYERDLAALANGAGKRSFQYTQGAGVEHQDGYINADLLRMCLLACNQVHGEDFIKAIQIVQLDYACDFYNQLVTMANTKGPRVSLDNFCRLGQSALAEQLRFLLQMGWARRFPLESNLSGSW